ncbi:MAG: helix-turn-helix domain-containing protein [Maritimibacter sp.]|nr:helix-turn-helix domain-containing protein [Maritimibacter sp.]
MKQINPHNTGPAGLEILLNELGPELQLVSRKQLRKRWQNHASDSSFWRAEKDGLLVPRRQCGVLGYDWRSIWEYEGGQPPVGLEHAYRIDLTTAEAIADLCPLSANSVKNLAKRGEIPFRQVGRVILFVPHEARTFLKRWA